MQSVRNKILVSGLMISAVIWYFNSYHPGMYLKELYVKELTSKDSVSKMPDGYDNQKIINADLIARLYKKSEDILSSKWNSSSKIDQMISAISNATDDGLNPDDYHLNDIENLILKISTSEKTDVEDVNKLELLLSDSFLLLSSHLSSGKTDPLTIDPLWKVPGRRVNPDPARLSDSTLIGGNITETLHHLLPVHPDYSYLKRALSKYRHLKDEGGWGTFTTSLPKLEYGMRHPDVSNLRKRLGITEGELKTDSADMDLFDEALRDEVVIFQQRNGLNTDGVVGKATIEALNIPVEERIETIEANLERWRWISDDLGEKYIRVNIANFELRVIENNKSVFESPVIVGRQYRETPVFSSLLKYLILNPDWVVPPTILEKDVLPLVMKDRSYLAKNNMKILKSDGTEIDTSAIDWNSMTEKSFPYMIRQEPGLKCPLGKVKFVFPNEYDVYIHDTPSHSLFSQNIRTFSSGCIRINNAIELAGYLLQDYPEWSLADIQKAVDKGDKRIIVLKNPVPVYVLYLTAWADENGTAYFGKDVYNRDRQLISALKQNRPAGINRNYLTRAIPVRNSTTR
jgi:L,D-transpeptidase YcbB